MTDPDKLTHTGRALLPRVENLQENVLKWRKVWNAESVLIAKKDKDESWASDLQRMRARRRQLRAERKALGWQKRVDELREKLKNAHRVRIQECDVDALERMEAKMIDVQSEIKAMRRVNAAWRRLGKPDPNDSWRVWEALGNLLYMTSEELVLLQEMMLRQNMEQGKRCAPYSERRTIKDKDGYGRAVARRYRNWCARRKLPTEKWTFADGTRVEVRPATGRVWVIFPNGDSDLDAATRKALFVGRFRRKRAGEWFTSHGIAGERLARDVAAIRRGEK